MLTYRSDTEFKKRFVKEVVWHRKTDAIVQGTYGSQNGHWTGCAVGCSLRSLDKIEGNALLEEYNDHPRFESEGLWPEWLARLEDTIFEGLPVELAKTWPERLAKAVPVGVDITPVKWEFSAFLLKENIERVLLLDIANDLKEKVVSSIRGVLSVHENAITSGEWNESAASAESAAWAAARSAESAWAAASASAVAASASAAASAWAAASAAVAAESATWAAAWSAESAAAASASAAWPAVRSAAIERYSLELLKLLKAAK